MAETKTTTRPRARRAAASTRRKAAPAEETATTTETETTVDRLEFELEPMGETKQYAVFVPPADSGCVGKLYGPKGASSVTVIIT